MVFTIHLWLLQETTSRKQLKNTLHKSVNPLDLETLSPNLNLSTFHLDNRSAVLMIGTTSSFLKLYGYHKTSLDISFEKQIYFLISPLPRGVNGLQLAGTISSLTQVGSISLTFGYRVNPVFRLIIINLIMALTVRSIVQTCL